MTSPVPCMDQVRNAIFGHENTAPNILSLARGGRSGYSVGFTQYDFHANLDDKITQQNFRNLLDQTQAVSGLNPLQIETIMGGITALGGSQSVEPYIPQINRALQTLQGWAFTTSADSQVLASDVQAVQGLLAAGGGRGAFNPNSPDYTTTIAELSEYVNQYGLHNPLLTTFLQ
ncbi:MAG TPA: hypothetical protein VJ779_08625 [Acetobacteraceae bacterium]|nr:hypothetical protein [Acetobacteraceae bacterium]